MRLVAIGALVVGCLCIVLAFVDPIYQSLICPGVVACVLGLIIVCVTGWIRAKPTVAAKDTVPMLFQRIAKDEQLHLVAGLRRPTEVDTLQQDLATASYCWSSIIQGGYAGRSQQQLILALSPWHLRKAPTAHELLHLARDVIFRCRNREAGQSLEETTGLLASAQGVREEVIVWTQTLCYVPFWGALELFPKLFCLGFLPFVGAYLFSHYVC